MLLGMFWKMGWPYDWTNFRTYAHGLKTISQKDPPSGPTVRQTPTQLTSASIATARCWLWLKWEPWCLLLAFKLGAGSEWKLTLVGQVSNLRTKQCFSAWLELPSLHCSGLLHKWTHLSLIVEPWWNDINACVKWLFSDRITHTPETDMAMQRPVTVYSAARSRSRDRKARRHATHQAQNHCLRLNYSRSFLTAINCSRFRSFRDGVLSALFSVHKCFVHKSHVLAEVLRVIMSIMEIPHVNVWWLTDLFTNASLWILLQLRIYSFRTYWLVMYHYLMLQRFFVVIGCSSFSGPQGRRVRLLCQTGWRWRQEDRKAGSLHLFLSSLDFAVPHSIV